MDFIESIQKGTHAHNIDASANLAEYFTMNKITLLDRTLHLLYLVVGGCYE